MTDWLIITAYVFGALHMVPAWHFGKAAGMRDAAKIVREDDWERDE